MEKQRHAERLAGSVLGVVDYEGKQERRVRDQYMGEGESDDVSCPREKAAETQPSTTGLRRRRYGVKLMVCRE